MRRTITRTATLAAVVVFSSFVPALGIAQAATDPVIATGKPIKSVTSANGSTITSISVRDEQSMTITVHSGSMDRDIPLDVLRPHDTSVPRPTLYLLNGSGGGEDGATWRLRTDAVQFLSDKNVNVVTPLKGNSSYYTDWKNPDPVLGVNKWTTFLTEELPPLIDAALGTDGVNSIAGLSSSGASVLALAEAAPGLYKGVAAYSGCAETSDPIGQTYVKLTVETWGGGNTVNMWGPPGDPDWAANDPYLNAEKLRGLQLYISNGSGLPGPHDTLDGPDIHGKPDVLANQIVVGGVIEAATDHCTRHVAARLAQLGIPAHFNFRPTGSHSWGYWQDDLKDSWPVLSNSLGL